MPELERKSAQRVQSSESEQSITNDSVSTAKSLPSVPIQQKTNGEKFKDEKEQHSTPSEEQFLFASPSTLPPEDSNSSENPVQGKFKSVAQLQKGFKAPALQFKTNTIQKQNKEEEQIQQKSNPIQRQIEEEEPVQAKSSNPNGLPATVQTQMEGALGADFSNVNIHTNSQSATDVGALAYTQGNDVHFAPGQYNPESSSGQELIGHELTHVVQQREGRVQPTTQAAGLPVNDDKGLESEADAGGQKAVQMKSEFKSTKSLDNNIFSNTIQKIEANPDNVNTSTNANSSPSQPINQDNINQSIDQQHDKDLFINHGVYGPRGVVPRTFENGAGYGGFDATYTPSSSELLIELRGKVSFLDSLSISDGVVIPNHPDFSGLANIISSIFNPSIREQIVQYYKWDDATKDTMLNDYILSVQSAVRIWSGTNMTFFIAQPGWEDITARPNFNLDITSEGQVDNSNLQENQQSHLQVKVYKSPLPQERNTVNQLINDNSQICPVADDNRKLRAYVDGDTNSSNYSDSNPNNGEMNLDSNDLFSRPENDRRGRNNFLRYNVFFANDSAEINNDELSNIQNFMQTFANKGDRNIENSNVNLFGFASASGTSSYNRKLVERRLTAVKEVLNGIGINNIAEQVSQNAGVDSTSTNKGDEQAELLQKDDYTQSIERRVEIRIGSGERQNTIAHELGHVFGLADEYEEDDRTAGDPSGHDRLAKNAGVNSGAPVENNDGIISMGNTIRPQHFSVFADALNQLTGKTWHIRS